MGFKEEFLALLESDIEFRYAVAGLLGFEEILRRIDANTEAIKNMQKQVVLIQKRIEEQGRILSEHTKILNEHTKILKEHTKMLEKHSVILEKHGKLISALTDEIRMLRGDLNALCFRYGICTEETFRESIKYLIEDLLKKYKVSKWVKKDEKDVVYGYPSIIEIDVLVRDKEVILVEYKASADKADVVELYRIGRFYEETEGVKPKLLLVSPTIRSRAKELADCLLYTSPSPRDRG
mgnify:CR=1 FL=1